VSWADGDPYTTTVYVGAMACLAQRFMKIQMASNLSNQALDKNQHNITGERAVRLPKTIDQRSSLREPDAVLLLIGRETIADTANRASVCVSFGSACALNCELCRNARSVALRSKWGGLNCRSSYSVAALSADRYFVVAEWPCNT
jgi:hypothetical protein